MKIREAKLQDLPDIKTLLPLLVAFDVPQGRNSGDFWQGDYLFYSDLLEKKRSDGFALVAQKADRIIATSLVSFRKELLNGKPSSHLEVIVVHPDFHGTGLGAKLLHETELIAKTSGAACMTLHAYSENFRARAFYDKHNYTGEFIRYRKVFS